MRCSPRHPWRYNPEMDAMLGHAMGEKINSSRQIAKPVRANAFLSFAETGSVSDTLPSLGREI